MKLPIHVMLCLTTMLMASTGRAETPVWESIAVYPADIHLATTTDLQHVVVVATRSDGVTLDITEKAKFSAWVRFLVFSLVAIFDSCLVGFG